MATPAEVCRAGRPVYAFLATPRRAASPRHHGIAPKERRRMVPARKHVQEERNNDRNSITSDSDSV